MYNIYRWIIDGPLEVTGVFFTFTPAAGARLPGRITKRTSDHLACQILRSFNVSLGGSGVRQVEVGEEVEVELTRVSRGWGGSVFMQGRLAGNTQQQVELSTETSPEDSGIDSEVATPDSRQIIKKRNKKLVFDESVSEDMEIVKEEMSETLSEPVKEKKRKKKKKEKGEQGETNQDPASIMIKVEEDMKLDPESLIVEKKSKKRKHGGDITNEMNDSGHKKKKRKT